MVQDLRSDALLDLKRGEWIAGSGPSVTVQPGELVSQSGRRFGQIGWFHFGSFLSAPEVQR